LRIKEQGTHLTLNEHDDDDDDDDDDDNDDDDRNFGSALKTEGMQAFSHYSIEIIYRLEMYVYTAAAGSSSAGQQKLCIPMPFVLSTLGLGYNRQIKNI